MADVNQAFAYVMDREDRNRTGKVTPDPTKLDPKAVARFGVNSAAHPDLVPKGFFNVMTNDQALQEAENVFKYEYFMHMGGYTIVDQGVCNKFCDLAFNMGISEATKIVQRALGDVEDWDPPIATDGIPGARTLACINAAPATLLDAIKKEADLFYRLLVQEHPQFAGDLDAWIARVNS